MLSPAGAGRALCRSHTQDHSPGTGGADEVHLQGSETLPDSATEGEDRIKLVPQVKTITETSHAEATWETTLHTTGRKQGTVRKEKKTLQKSAPLSQ